MWATRSATMTEKGYHMPNPSEQERREQEYNFHAAQATDLRFPKGFREEHLREARRLERELDIPEAERVKI